MSRHHEPFVYNNAEVVRVIDGDTVRLKVDVGFRMVYEDNFRLEGIDTPERGKKGFTESTQRMSDWLLANGNKVRVEVTKRDKYGRYLAKLISISSGEIVNEVMVTEGYAKEYFGGKR